MKQLLALLSISITLLLTACMPNYSEGFRIGIVQKASHKGIIFRSYEGEIVTDGFKSGNQRISNTWKFSAVDPSIIQSLNAAADNGTAVKVSYNQWLIKPLFTQDTSYTVNKVTEVRQ